MKDEKKVIILVRHAEAGPKDLPIPDKDRPLTQGGMNDLKLMKPALLRQSIKPEHIFSSSANRTAQTATILADFYNMCDNISFYDELYHPAPQEIVGFIRRRDDELRNIMIVGHNPELMEAAELLWQDSFDTLMPTSACICLSFDIERWDGIQEKTGKMEYYEYPKENKEESDHQ